VQTGKQARILRRHQVGMLVLSTAIIMAVVMLPAIAIFLSLYLDKVFVQHKGHHKQVKGMVILALT